MPFVKGKSGNPGGRPSDKPWTEALRKVVYENDAEGRKRLYKIAEACVTAAEGGDIVSIKEIGDRLDGKPAQDSTLTIEKRDATDWSLSELVALFHERRAARARDITPRGSSGELN
jgi:hypothetical protein